MIRPRSPFLSWLIAALLVGVTFGITLALDRGLGVATPILFVIPVALASWMGGIGPGLFATLLCALLFNMFISEPFGVFSTDLGDVVRIAALIFVALAVTTLDASRRRLEHQVEASRDELNYILQESGDGITVQGPDGRLIYANPEGARIIGYDNPAALISAPPQEVMARFEVMDEQGKPLPLTDLPSRRALAGETPPPMVLRFRAKGAAHERWSLVSANPVRNADGSLRFVVNNFQDITAIKQAESGMQTERERLLVTIASIGDAVIATDAAGKITFLNRIAETLTGWTSAEAAGQPLPVVFDIIDEMTRETIPNPVEVALRENRPVELANSALLRTRSGITIPIEDSAAPICDEDGKVSGVVLVFRDVTGKKRRDAVRRFINEISRAFDTSLDFDVTIQTIAEMAVPGLSDWCTIDLIGKDGRLYEAALMHSDLGKQRTVHDMRMAGFEADPQVGLVTRVAQTGESMLWSDYSEETARQSGWTEKDIATLLSLGLKSTLILPLKARGTDSGRDEVIGVLSLTQAESGREWTQEDLALGEQLADRAAVAIQNARLYRDAQAQRERLRVTLASIGDAVIATDTNGRIVFMNAVAEKITGWSQSDANGKPLKDVFVIVNETTREIVESPVTKVLREGKIVGLANHTILVARDGTEVPIDDSGAPIRDGDGDMMGVILVFRDITERKATEAQIESLGATAEAERKRLDEIVRNIPGVVWEAWGEPDKETQRINYVSPYVEEMLGYTREEWLATPNFWHTIVHPDDQEGASARARATFDSKEAGSNQFRWITKDGRAIWVEAHSRVVLDEDGKPVGMRGVTFDITERKNAADLLVEQNEVIETINRVGQSLSGELDLETLLQSLTDAATEITGAQFGSFFYNVVNTEGESYMLYTLSGVPREKFSVFPMPRNTHVFAPTFNGEGVVRSDDITKDPRYGQNPPYHGKPEGHLPVVSYLAIPVISRSGEVIGGLFFGHEKPGMFTEREEQIVVGLAAQAAIAVDNARLFREANAQREQLRESEEQLRLITDNTPALISYIDADYRYQFNNRAYEEWFGHSREEVKGKTTDEVLGKEAMDGLRPHMEKALRGELAEFEAEIPYRDAGLRYIHASYVPDFAPEGEVRGFFVLVHDLSERRTMENALRESEARFRTVANATPVLIWMAGADSLCDFFNKQWLEYTGRTLEQEQGNGWAEGVHPDDLERCLGIYQTHFKMREPFEMEYRLRRYDGEYRWFVDQGIPRFNTDGTFAGFIGALIDIHDRRRVEQTQSFLADVSEVLATSLDYEYTLEQIAHLAVPRIADWAAIDLLDEHGAIQRVAVHHSNPDKIELFWKLWDLARPTLDEPAGTGKVIRTGEPDLFFEIPPALLEQYEEPIRSLLQSLGLRATIVLPMTLEGKTIGSLTMAMAESGRSFNESDVDVAQEIARRAAVAIDRSRLYREAGEQRERLSVTLASIGDAVIATDEQGRVTFINAVAGRLTGWSTEDAVGERIEAVFHIVNEETGELAENPVQRVLDTGEIVGLANHTVLVSREGERIPIDDSGAPIRMTDGEIAGVILVFRDIRERKATEAQRELYAREQEFVAFFGQRAMSGADLDTLFEDAARGLVGVLGVEYSKMLELLPDGKELLLRCGVGWKPGVVGERRVGAGVGSHGGYTLLSSQPVIIDRLSEETRFDEPLLTEHNVVSGISTIITGPDGEPWGTLGVHTTHHRRFTQDDIHFLQAIANVLSEALQRNQAEQTRESYAAQQAVVAKLGQQALMGLDIQQLMEESVRAAAATLRVDYVKVLQLMPDGDELLLRAGVGWKPGLVGTRRVSAGTGSHAGFSLLAKSPVTMDDLRMETRFTEPLLTEHDVISGLSVLIEGRDGHPWGVLGAHTRTQRDFSVDDIHFIQAVANILAESIQRKQAREDLERSLERTRDLYEISRQIGTLNSPQQILEALVTSNALHDVRRAIITLFNTPWVDTPPETADLVAEWMVNGLVQTSRIGERYPLATYELARVIKRNEPVIVGNVATDSRLSELSREFSLAMGINSYIVFPLIASNQWFGLLSLQWDQPYVAGEEDARHLQGLVDQAASAIYNLRLLEDEARARRAAEKADALKMKFLAMISHELRTPLTSIKGFTTTLLSEDVAWDAINQREFLSIINEESDNLTDLIEQLLDLSRLEAGTLTIQKRVQPLSEIFTQAMPQLFMIAQNHRLEVDLPTELPQVNADGRRIAQVITNVVANAAKYSPEGTVIRMTAAVNAHQVQINVIDQGPGIPEAEFDTVFEAFRQAQNRPKEETKGAGLGLAISRGLIEAHGGSIWVAESGSAGTTVSFTLPIEG